MIAKLRTVQVRLFSVAVMAAIGLLAAGHGAVSANPLLWDPAGNGSNATFGTGTWDTGTWSNGTSDQSWVSSSDAIFGGTQSGTATVTLTNPQTANSVTLNTSGYVLTGAALAVSNSVTVNGTTDEVDNNLNGAAAVNVTGGGYLTLGGNGANSFSGGLNILSGTLKDNTAPPTGNELGSGAITIGSGANNATLLYNAHGNATYANAISVTGTGTNEIEVTNYNPTFTGAVTLNSSNLTLLSNNNGGSTLSFTGAITGTGNVTLQVDGTHLNSNGVNIGAGGINNTGTITNNGTGTAAQTVTISGVIGSNVTNVTQDSAGTSLVLSNHGDSYGTLNILSGTLIDQDNGATGTQLGTGTVTLGSGANNATLNLDLGTTVTYSNAISVNGSGTNTIETTSYYSVLNGAIALNSSNLALVTNNTHGSYTQVNGGITGTGNVILQVDDNHNTSYLTIGAGGINNTGTITNNGVGSAGQTVTISGVIGTNVTNVTQNSADTTLLLTNKSDNYGSLSILSGTLKDTASDGSSGTELGSGTISIGSGNNNATLNLNLNGGYPVTFSNAISVNGTGTNTIEVTNFLAIFSGAVTLNNSNLMLITDNNNWSTLAFNGGIGGTGNVTLQVNDTNNRSSVSIGAGGINNAGTITNNGTGTAGQSVTISGAIGSNVTGVTQDSADTKLVLTGHNLYTGPTTVSAGTLTINGIQANSNITIASGATVNGSGTITYNLANNTGDLITDGGTLDISGLNLALNITGTQTQSKYLIANYTGGTLLGSTFASVTGLQAGWSINYGVLQPNEVLLVNNTAVPEPASLGLLGAGVLALSLLGRRRKVSA